MHGYDEAIGGWKDEMASEVLQVEFEGEWFDVSTAVYADDLLKVIPLKRVPEQRPQENIPPAPPGLPAPTPSVRAAAEAALADQRKFLEWAFTPGRNRNLVTWRFSCESGSDYDFSSNKRQE